MTTPELTLKQVRTSIKAKNFRASDFLSQEQMEEVHEANAKGKQRKYNAIDAYIAEIISRFGYATYVAWKNGDISEDNMMRYIEAERARDIYNQLAIESIIIASVAGANNPSKSGHSPKSLKTAIKILKQQQDKAKGAF